MLVATVRSPQVLVQINPFVIYTHASLRSRLIRIRIIESELDNKLDCAEVSAAAQHMEKCNERKLLLSNNRKWVCLSTGIFEKVLNYPNIWVYFTCLPAADSFTS
jgi:hypothetical protein